MPANKYTDDQRQLFLETLDRGGTVRAARVAGVHPDAGYRWVRKAGLFAPRGAPRRYSVDDRARFFQRLTEAGNVSAVARELGFVRVTCYKWAHQAGVFTGKNVEPLRAEFLRLRAAGKTRAEAASEVEVDKRSAADWDKGIRTFYGGRVYPDGRVVKYRPEEILAGVKTPRTAYVQGERVDLDRIERVIHDRYVSLLEREQIHDLRRAGTSVRQIAVSMGRAPSTISRELRRNASADGGYMPYAAHRRSVTRRARPKSPRLQREETLKLYVASKLRQRWSPEQIARRLIKEFPSSPQMRVSTETIYQAIYVHCRGELTRCLSAGLRRGHRSRKPRKVADARTRRFVHSMTPISQRPAHVEDRLVFGHWEGDLVRHEALCNRAEVKDLRRCAVAAA